MDAFAQVASTPLGGSTPPIDMSVYGLFMQARPLYARFPDSHMQNRCRWVAGKIARGLGQVREAEAHLLPVRVARPPVHVAELVQNI